MSVNVRERMKEREKGKGREEKEGKGVGEERGQNSSNYGSTGGSRELARGWQNCRKWMPGLCRGCLCSPGWAGWARAWQAALCHHETAVSYPWSLFSHSHSRCVQPTQQPRLDGIVTMLLLWTPSTRCGIWEGEGITRSKSRLAHFTCTPLLLLPARELIIPHPLVYADGEVVAALIPGRAGQLASHRGKFLLSSRQIAVTFVQAGGTKAAPNDASWLLKKQQKASVAYCPSGSAFCRRDSSTSFHPRRPALTCSRHSWILNKQYAFYCLDLLWLPILDTNNRSHGCSLVPEATINCCKLTKLVY